MNRSRRRIHEELRMVEKQLPLYYRKINELERRQKELRARLEEQQEKIPGYPEPSRRFSTADFSDRQRVADEKGQGYNDHPFRFHTPPRSKTLGAKAKANAVRVLGEAREKFSLLGEGISQALTYIDTMVLVLELMEQSGGELQQHLLRTASAIQQQVNNPSVNNSAYHSGGTDAQQNENPSGFSLEALMEIIKSPHFQQLADQLKGTVQNYNN